MTPKHSLSVIIPCLNEEQTIAACVKKAVAAIRRTGLKGEVLVVDNGSTDASARLARQAGARVVAHTVRGYGSALKRGIAEARGDYLLMADADNTYDLNDLPKFIERLEAGADLVMGSRLRGRIHPKAMPWLHRWVGTPVLTALLNLFFKARITDTNCGMRAFTKTAVERLHLRCNGMEFASEMIIKAAQRRLRILETPIDYYPGAPDRKPKLNTFRDGWRHLRFMLVLAPDYLFLVPGALLALAGLGLSLVLWTQDTVTLFRVPLGLSTGIFANALLLLGLQIMLFGIYAITFNTTQGLMEEDAISRWVKKYFTLEGGLLVGGLLGLAGLVTGGVAIGHLMQVAGRSVAVSVPVTKLAISAIFLVLLGIQLSFSAFYLSLFNLTKTLE